MSKMRVKSNEVSNVKIKKVGKNIMIINSIQSEDETVQIYIDNEPYNINVSNNTKDIVIESSLNINVTKLEINKSIRQLTLKDVKVDKIDVKLLMKLTLDYSEHHVIKDIPVLLSDLDLYGHIEVNIGCFNCIYSITTNCIHSYNNLLKIKFEEIYEPYYTFDISKIYDKDINFILADVYIKNASNFTIELDKMHLSAKNDLEKIPTIDATKCKCSNVIKISNNNIIAECDYCKDIEAQLNSIEKKIFIKNKFCPMITVNKFNQRDYLNYYGGNNAYNMSIKFPNVASITLRDCVFYNLNLSCENVALENTEFIDLHLKDNITLYIYNCKVYNSGSTFCNKKLNVKSLIQLIKIPETLKYLCVEDNEVLVDNITCKLVLYAGNSYINVINKYEKNENNIITNKASVIQLKQ